MEVYQSSRTAAEMEYALGAVPSIGENGNWFIGEQDTGIFAKGINVTGAEVGQTVKVAAVDENGVPTAWEPGDLNEWRLLKTVDLTEDVLAIGPFGTDDDGNPFELKGAIVTISGANPSKSTMVQFNLTETETTNYATSAVSSTNCYCEPTYQTNNTVFGMVKNVCGACEIAFSNSANLNLRHGGYWKRNGKFIYLFSRTADILLPAGAHIEFWGIDA